SPSPLPPHHLHSFPTRRSSDLLLESSTTLPGQHSCLLVGGHATPAAWCPDASGARRRPLGHSGCIGRRSAAVSDSTTGGSTHARSEEHTSELQSRSDLVCRLLL